MNNMDKMLSSASEKLGIKPESLKKALETGNLNDVYATMKSEDAQKLKAILENKAMIEKLMKSPGAAEMLRQFGKK